MRYPNYQIVMRSAKNTEYISFYPMSDHFHYNTYIYGIQEGRKF